MDNTEQEQQLAQRLTRRRRNTVIGMILMIPSGFLAGFGIAASGEGISILGIPANVWTLASLAIFAGSIIFCAANWRCPACGASLPIYAKPPRCKTCDTDLR